MLANEMISFYYVVFHRSYSKAAEALQASKSHVSKQIQFLEQQLNVKLLNRNTRHLSLTYEGEVFFESCKKIYDNMQTGCETIRDMQDGLSGTLKISMPHALGVHVMDKIIADFSKQNPHIKLFINLENKIEDVIAQGYDITLRSAKLKDSNLIAQKIGACENILCASSEFIKKHDEIKTTEQLRTIKLAAYNNNSVEYILHFTKDGKKISQAITPEILSNSASLILKLVLENLCAATLPKFMVKKLIEDKKIIPLLPKFKLKESDLFAVYPARNPTPTRVKNFIDYMKKSIGSAIF